MKNILIDVKVNQEKMKELQEIEGINIEVVEYREKSRIIPKDILKDKNILFCMFPPRNFADLDTIEFIQVNSAGYGQLLGLGLAEKGIRACNARGVSNIPIAEWSMAMMINLARDMKSMMRNQEAKIWDRSARFQSEIRGLKLGIWGYGAIGRETARLAKAFGMKVYSMDMELPGSIRHDIYRVEGTGDPEGKLQDKAFVTGEENKFLKDLDFLVISMPLTNNTKGLIGKEELKALPSTAYVLNPARGPIIQEEALLTALKEGWIAGAALDTHYYYPLPADHPLWELPNVVITPHISGSSLSSHFMERSWDIFVQNVKRLLSSQPLLNELSQAQLEGE